MIMRFALTAAAHRRAGRARSTSLSAVPPPEDSDEYLPELAAIAASILYRSPLLSPAGRPVYVLNAAAFPDAYEVDYDSLLSYVLARLPAEDELISGTEYEIIFFAGGQPENATAEKKQGPSTGWYLQAYHVLGRATRKKLQMLYIVHPRTWVRVLISIFGTIVSPKFRRKIVHVNSISALAFQIPIENVLIPPSAYLHDRKVTPDIYSPYVTGRRAFGVRHPLPKNITTKESRLPRVIRETTSFLLMPSNIKTEGLFRIPPQSMLAGILKEAYDRGQQFIVWKEGDEMLAPPGLEKSMVDEIRPEDTYGVHLAASLIKTWYRELKEPLFPESCYRALEEKYGDASRGISVEDVVDLILPASQNSLLTLTARHIMIRHLLPLLSAVASHADENKMTSENLAILFSMCILRGSNQLEDTKVSNTVRRILIEAINSWPQLRAGLDIGNKSFELDLRPPADPRDYEDPLEDDTHHHRSSEDNAVEDRITMNESDTHTSVSNKTPMSLPRRSRAASLKAAQHMIDALPSLPRRKHAAAARSESESPNAEDPPRYSTVVEVDSMHPAESPIHITPANGFGPPRRSGFSFEDVRGGKTSPTDDFVPQPTADMPRRKVLPSPTSETKMELGDARNKSESQSYGPSGLLAQMSASVDSSHHTADESNAKSTVRPLSSSRTWSHDDNTKTNSPVQRKTSAHAAIDRGVRQPSDIHSLARPVIPVQQAHTMPIPRKPSNNSLSVGSVPKPRAPSPGLLKRMTSIESFQAQQGTAGALLRPKAEARKQTLQKASVDDLRRLYEDRLDTAKSLEIAANSTNDQATN